MYHRPLGVKSDQPQKCLLCGSAFNQETKMHLNQYCEASGAGLKDIYRGTKINITKGARTIHALIIGATVLTQKARIFLERHQDAIVQSATIQRVPMNSAIQGLIDVFTLGTKSRVLDDQDYDALFHLSIIFATNKDNNIKVEKNQVINMELTN